ncbi:ABC transporter ATP-binding protein [Candidatus Woesearchaeota archaeon]|nr:ABC transporter ATP-binding protein [Candidatus Woesearchaeota archaeon]
MIELRNVHKTYQMGKVSVQAVRGVSLKVSKGEFIAIMGPSGSGKTTLLNMIGCLDVPTRGEILLKGVNINTLSRSELAEIRGKAIGFVFQSFNLIQTLSALENVQLPMIFQGVPKDVRVKRAKELLSRLGLEPRMHHKPAELSGGQQQRVAIARALANNPDVIIADEPTGNLDSKAGCEVMEVFKELNLQGTTIVLVTHEEHIARYASRIIQLKDGKIQSNAK